MQVDTLIFGGGAAGLWLLDELTRNGCRAVLLEAAQLGRGQTVASQGIIHGGLKYTLGGLLTRSAAGIRDMPVLWRDCLAGRRQPDLSRARLRGPCCHLWRTGSVRSRLGMIGARFGLRVAPQELARDDRPPVLRNCPGTVARLDEQVISPVDFLTVLSARHRERILRIDAERGLQFDVAAPGHVRGVRLVDPVSQRVLQLRPVQLVFAAGGGNAGLRGKVGLAANLMQKRPLHMVMLRGPLPVLNGHCVDAGRTRVTITSDTDSGGRTVWQVGGQIAEDGVEMRSRRLMAHAAIELKTVLPSLDLSRVLFATYRVDRAEGAARGGRRPENVQVFREGNVVTAWPTKLALVPRLAEEIGSQLAVGPVASGRNVRLPKGWPRPDVALPPWETCSTWRRFRSLVDDARRAA